MPRPAMEAPPSITSGGESFLVARHVLGESDHFDGHARDEPTGE